MNKKKSTVHNPQSTVEELQKQVHELTMALQHERADATNLRRRHEEQVGGLKNLVKANVVRDLLPVIDSFEKLLQHISSNPKVGPWKQEVEVVGRQFAQVLKTLNVERIKTVGEVFDPKFHEAVSMEDGDGSVEVVCEELQPGYKIGDDIIRHAMVKVKMEEVNERS